MKARKPFNRQWLKRKATLTRRRNASTGTNNSAEHDNSFDYGEGKHNKDWKHLHHNYDHHYDQNVSKVVHRGDLSSTTRLLGYTDAMMATCATFLVLPIRHLQSIEDAHGHVNGDHSSLAGFLHSKQLEIITFFFGFLIVCTVWESINIRAIVVKRLDDVLVLMSILSMLFTTVLPFAIALQGHFPGDKISITAMSAILVLIELLEIIMVFYSFASPDLLHMEMNKWDVKDLKEIRNALLNKSIANIVFVALAGLFDLLDYRVSWVMLAMLILNPLLRQFYLYVKRRRERSFGTQHSDFFWFLAKGNISKERVEAFTDAATAIIACVLILDITIIEFPKLDEVAQEKLWDKIIHMKHELFTFFGAYILVSLLWYVNHTLLHLYHTVNTVALYTQKIFLCFLSLMPLCSNLVNNFTLKRNVDSERKQGIRVGSILIFLASGCNAILMIWGFFKGQKVLHSWSVDNATRRDKQNHLYIIFKSLNMPFWAFLTFLGTFANADAAYYIFMVGFFSMIVCFVGMKFLLVNNVGKNFAGKFSTKRRRRRQIVIRRSVDNGEQKNSVSSANGKNNGVFRRQFSHEIDGDIETGNDVHAIGSYTNHIELGTVAKESDN